MSSKLSQMRAQFRERLTITPSNNSSVIATKVSDGNNNIIKTTPLIGAQKYNTTVNSRIIPIKQSIPQISRNVSTSSSVKVKNERNRANPTISRISINTNAQKSTNTTNTPNKDNYKTTSKVSLNIKNTPKIATTPKTYAKVNQNSDSKLFPQRSRGITELLDKKQTVSSQSKPRVNSQLKSFERIKREPFQRGSSEGTPCSFCGRFFALTERLQKHESVCESSTSKARTQFESNKQRFKGQPKDYLRHYENSLNNPHENVANKSNWRAQHQYFLAAIREAKGDSSSGPSTSQITASTQEACSYCKRRFNDDALKRHIPICAKLYHKRVMNY